MRSVEASLFYQFSFIASYRERKLSFLNQVEEMDHVHKSSSSGHLKSRRSQEKRINFPPPKKKKKKKNISNKREKESKMERVHLWVRGWLMCQCKLRTLVVGTHTRPIIHVLCTVFYGTATQAAGGVVASARSPASMLPAYHITFVPRPARDRQRIGHGRGS